MSPRKPEDLDAAIRDGRYDFDDCADIIRRLRSEDGCPWDNEQSYESLRKYFLEEAYEAIDAVDRRDFAGLREELGDVLWEILFMARIAEQDGHFRMEDVPQTLGEKMIRRHPHIFGPREELSSDEVVTRWETIKKSEGRTDKTHHILAKVPASLPSLLRAFRVSERAAKAGFDWENADQVAEKVREEWNELDEVRREGDLGRIEEELGDLLFVLVNYGRHLGVSAEDGLRGATEKFIRRFTRLENRLHEGGESFGDKSLEELEALWQRVKADIARE